VRIRISFSTVNAQIGTTLLKFRNFWNIYIYYIKYVLSTVRAGFLPPLPIEEREFGCNSTLNGVLRSSCSALEWRLQKNAAAEAAALVRESCRLRS
jgi:hypothetical protein